MSSIDTDRLLYSLTERATRHGAGFGVLALSYPQTRERLSWLLLFSGAALSMLICRWYLLRIGPDPGGAGI